jgi:mitochondrial fission protein ELM1
MVALAAEQIAQPDDPGPVVWVLHDGKAGMASQALGLAEATGFRFVEKRLSIRRPWAWLPPQLWRSPLAAVTDANSPLQPPWPDLVIACGRNVAMPALAIRRASNGRTVAAQIQDPRVGHDEFDLMFVPEHDRWRSPQVFVTSGALNRVTPERLAAERQRFPMLEKLPRPILAVLIGGSNRIYRLTMPRLADLAEGVAAAVLESGGSTVVTPSRRTGAEGLALVRARLAGIPSVIWDGAGANPYYAYLAVADAVLVTSDSVSMISEAAATGKPVYIFDLVPGGRGGDKFARFHKAMAEAGITRPFADRIENWTYEPPDDTARAGAIVRDFVLTRLSEKRAAA